MTTADSNFKCTGCHKDNQSGMSFCMYCGLPLPGAQALSGPFIRTCPSCGKADELTNRFCIYCGHDSSMGMQILSAQPAAAEEMSQTAQSYVLTAEVQPPGRGPQPYLLKVAALVAGCALGIGASYLMSGWLQQQLVHSVWPRQGLVMYVQPPQSQVMLEESGGANFTLGRTGPGGGLSIPDLAPGQYRVSFTSPGYKTLEQSATVEEGKLAVLGFPDPLQLSR